MSQHICITKSSVSIFKVPCTHALLAKWIPPQERSRMGAVVYAGAQFGTIISMPLSGLLAEHSWPSIFYVFGALGVVWSLAFLWTVHEDPSSSPKISEPEKKYINTSLWGNGTTNKSPAIPWKSIFTSMPFYAILFAHVSLTLTRTVPMDGFQNVNEFTDGTKLWLWVLDDWVADIHEANSEILNQRGERDLIRHSISAWINFWYILEWNSLVRSLSWHVDLIAIPFDVGRLADLNQ